MQKLFFTFFTGLILSFFSNSQTYNSYYGSIVASYNYDTILTYLNEFEALGVKEIGTTALSNTQNWIIDKYNSYGYSQITVQPFTYFGNSTANIIIKKEGCQFPDTYVIVDGHYDTKNGTGTNDNGSGTAIILEMARQLKDVDTKYSILFIHFSGEEDGLIGSQFYVNNTVIPTSMDIKLVFNIDEVGGVSWATNNTIVCERDEGSPAGNNAQSAIVTDQLAVCTGLYSNLNTEISFAYGSDYVPFEENGEVITGFYEKNETPYAHTSNDLLVNMDPVYVHEVGKAATGATLFFAEAYDQTSMTVTACNNFVSPSGNYTWTTTGIYTDTLLTGAGCDSILSIDLSINPVDVGVDQNGYLLSATNIGADTYQWLDCDLGNVPISGETGISYTATSSGNYAVAITENTCTDTSACIFVEVWGIEENNPHGFEIFPNPAQNQVTISQTSFSSGTALFYDATGKLILSTPILEKEQSIDITELSQGVYLLGIENADGTMFRTRISVLH